MIIYVNRKENLVFNETDYRMMYTDAAANSIFELDEDFLNFIDKTYTPRQAFILGRGRYDEIVDIYADYLQAEDIQNWEKMEI
jgi:hypothetical protein